MKPTKNFLISGAIAACFAQHIDTTHAQDLNIKLPAQEENILSQKMNILLPAQPLSTSLKALSLKSGITISYNDQLVAGKNAVQVSGFMDIKDALQRLLTGHGLIAKVEENNVYIHPAPKAALEKRDENTNLALEKVEVRAKKFYEIGPMPGLALTKEEIPGNVQSISAKEIKESNTLTITDLMNQKLQSVTVNDYQSNPFQMDLQYRGFTASPQLGTAQGISVFLDGIRVNEPFGDVVNWDMIPMNALSSLDIFPGSNPVFGLGTLGGALSMRTKSGFDGKTLDAQVLTGSFGRKQLQVSAGNNNGAFAGFLSGNFFLEDGWRNDSPSKVNQVFGKAEWQGERAKLGLSMLYAGNKLTGNGLLPQQMVDQNPKQVYTSPDESKNNLLQFQLSGVWDVSETFNITGQIYNRNSKRKSHTSDVNENFGGSDGNPATASTKDSSRQLLQGLPDINRDGLPDYNDYAWNVAADKNYFALDKNGNSEFVVDANGDPVLDGSGQTIVNPNFDINNLAYGTSFDSRANPNQAQVPAQDASGTMVWNWVPDPRWLLDGQDNFQKPSQVPGAFNAPVLSSEYAKLVRYTWENRGLAVVTNSGAIRAAGFEPFSNTQHPGRGSQSYSYDVVTGALSGGVTGGYTDSNGFFHDYWELTIPVNQSTVPFLCPTGALGAYASGPCVKDANGNYIYRDGKYSYINNGSGSSPSSAGYIEGTPTAIFNDTQIDQLGKGAAMQLNWNLEQHKLMLGASYDTSDSTYVSKQYLGFLDKNRHGYTDPDQLGWEYFTNSKQNGFGLNDFKGDNTTKSIYLSETWTPIKSLNITAAARFNHTEVNNQLAVSRLTKFGDANRILNLLNWLTLCTDNDNDGVVEASECPTGLDGYIVPFEPRFGFISGNNFNYLGMDPGEKERFKYRSFNPSLGVTWQANEDLNLYGNVSRGARTPTTIELGCAFDDSPVFDKFGADGKPIYVPRTWRERRTCNLPGAMSGDPYLKQVRSTSVEFGARGHLTENLQWNASLYRTDLTDDIYFVSVNAIQSYFQNIGDTRRQGLEMGLKGKYGKASFGINYALTDATFQSEFTMASPNNSSAGNVYDLNFDREGKYGQITVKPGNRMPGVPLHNLNLNVGYEITDQWNIRLNMVAHSNAFVRGNENNEHQAGPATPLFPEQCLGPNGTFKCQLNRADWREGKSAGYAVLNLQSSYKLSPEWTFGIRINNILDKEYASAGRLGLNAFSPATNGAVGVSGFNYNSSEWQGTSFLGTGAPRSAFITLSYEFQPKKLDGLQE